MARIAGVRVNPNTNDADFEVAPMTDEGGERCVLKIDRRPVHLWGKLGKVLEVIGASVHFIFRFVSWRC